MMSKSFAKRSLMGAYVLAVLVSVLLCNVKFRSLGFHTRDYAFYMEFATKLLNVNDADTYSINPDGQNWLYMAGVEGTDSLHQAIHLEPIKYAYAVLYWIFKAPVALFFFVAMVFFIPLPFLALVVPMNSEADVRYVLSIGLLFLLSPAVLFAPAFDLRPYIFLAPFFLLAVLSIQLSRPVWEKLLWFNAMFLAREEAIILGGVVLLFGLARLFSHKIKFKELLILSASYCLWVAGTIVYLSGTGYSVITKWLPPLLLKMYFRLLDPSPLLIIVIASGAVAGGVIVWFSWRNLRELPLFQGMIELLAIGTVFIPLGYQLLDENWQIGQDPYLFSPRYFLHYTALILFIVVMAGHLKITPRAGMWARFMMLGFAAFILNNTLAPDGFLKSYTQFNHAARPARVIWSFKGDLDPVNSSLLVDYSTHQAFYGFEHIYAYNRLPWSLASGRQRYYPENRSFLEVLITGQIDYVVISHTSLDDINSLLTETSTQVQVVFENEQYIGLEILR
jgi:hypothetical protein